MPVAVAVLADSVEVLLRVLVLPVLVRLVLRALLLVLLPVLPLLARLVLRVLLPVLPRAVSADSVAV